MQPHKIFYVSKQLYCSEYKSQIYQDDEKVAHKKNSVIEFVVKNSVCSFLHNEFNNEVQNLWAQN